MNSDSNFELLELAWSEIELGARSRKAPWRNPTLGTLSNDGVQLRTITLRLAIQNERKLQFNSDIRSDKIGEIKQCNEVTLMHYDLPSKLQIRVWGVAEICFQNAVCREAWEKTVVFARRCYMANLGTSTKVDEPNYGFPEEFVDKDPTLEESEVGYQNFCTIATLVHKIDVVKLSHAGHIRCSYQYIDSQWDHQWLVP